MKRKAELSQEMWQLISYRLMKGMDIASDDEIRDMGLFVPEAPRPAGKKRGAPRGNQNARKHGLYSRIAPSRNRGDMGKALAMGNLSEEIAIVRMLLANLLAEPEKNMGHIVQLYKVLTQMFRVNHPVTAEEEELKAMLDAWS